MLWTLVKSSHPSAIINLIRDIGAYSVILITSVVMPALTFGISFDLPISVNDIALACLQPSITTFLAIEKTKEYKNQNQIKH